MSSTFDQTLERTAGDTTAGTAADPVGAATPADVPSIVRVFTTSDHKVIGRLFISSSLLGLLVAAGLGVLLGIERIDGHTASGETADTLFDLDALTQMFAGYRVALVLAVVLPLFLGISLFAVPLQLGARSLSFPRAAAAGFWTWFGGVVLLVIALVNNGGPFGGNADMVILYLAAMVLTLVGLTAVAGCIATSVLTTRAPGMRLQRAPLFSWSALVFSLGLVLVLPVAAGVHVMLYVDYRYAQGAFGTARGILDWTFYLYTGPVLALFAVAAVGFVAEVAPVVFAKRTPLRAAALAGIGLLGIGALAGVTQQDVINVPWAGERLAIADGDAFWGKVRDLITFGLLVVLPIVGVLVVLGVVSLMAKPERGRATPRPRLISPFVFALFGLGLILLGLVAAAVNSIDDLGLQGTVFEEGATLAVVYGAVTVGLGAISYWMPKLSGRTLGEKHVLGLAPVAALGGALASVPLLVAGFLDQPGAAPSFSNQGPSTLLNLGTTVGHGLVLLAVVGFAGLALPALAGRTGRGAVEAGDNPWDAHTLEWTTTSPAPADNFSVDAPTVMSAEPVLDQRAAPDFSDERGAA